MVEYVPRLDIQWLIAAPAGPPPHPTRPLDDIDWVTSSEESDGRAETVESSVPDPPEWISDDD